MPLLRRPETAQGPPTAALRHHSRCSSSCQRRLVDYGRGGYGIKSAARACVTAPPTLGRPPVLGEGRAHRGPEHARGLQARGGVAQLEWRKVLCPSANTDTPRNPGCKALRWLRVAVEGGHHRAQSLLCLSRRHQVLCGVPTVVRARLHPSNMLLQIVGHRMAPGAVH